MFGHFVSHSHRYLLNNTTPCSQVTFYVHFLSLIFSKEIATGQLHMSEKGGVWLQPSHIDSSVSLLSSIQEFHLKPWLQLLQEHLHRSIPDSLSGSIEDVPWRLNTNCSSCPYLVGCRRDKACGADIRAVPHVSAPDSKLLQDLPKRSPVPDNPHDVRSVRALHALLSQVVSSRVLPSHEQHRALRAIGASVSPALPVKQSSLGALTSIIDHSVLMKDQQRCGTFPNNTDDFPIYVSLCCDPANELPIACAVRSFPGEDFSMTATYSSDQDDTKHQQEQLLVDFLVHLCEIVQMAAAKTVSPCLTFYVWEPLERTCLTQLVIKALCGELSHLLRAVPDLTARVHYLALVLLDFPEQWELDAPPKPEYNYAATPRICDIVGQFRALVHLPIRGFYSPSTIASCMNSPDPVDVVDIAVESIERDWSQQSKDASERLRSRVDKLKIATNYLRRNAAKNLLFNKSAALPSTSAVDRSASTHPVLQRLVFMKHVDALVRCSEKRRKRIASLNDTELEVRLRCTAKHENSIDFQLVSGPPVFADRSPHIRKWCLARDKAETIVNFVDLMYLSESRFSKNREVAFVSVDVPNAHVLSVRCEVPTGFAVNIGDVCVLFAREVDLNLAKSIDSLESMGADCNAHPTTPRTFIDLVEDPNAWSARACGITGICAETVLSDVLCSALESGRGCVDSIYQDAGVDSLGPLSGAQTQALQSLLHSKLTVLWGPPGTSCDTSLKYLQLIISLRNFRYW